MLIIHLQDILNQFYIKLKYNFIQIIHIQL
jgi:hypothetical protein